MRMVRCPRCQEPILEPQSGLCPRCGARTDASEWSTYRTPRGRTYRVITACLLSGVGLSIMVLMVLTLLSLWRLFRVSGP